MNRPAEKRSRDLMARVDAEVRDRIVETIDFVCLDVMVQARQVRGLPAPAPDSTKDRAEFDERVEALLVRLGDQLSCALDAEQRRSFDTDVERAEGDRLARLLAVQVALAKLLPDYWQRFELVRVAFTAEGASAAPTSGRDRPGWLGRLLGG